MSFSDLDYPLWVKIFTYCVNESSFSLVLTCREFKDLIYSTGELLYEHCLNVNSPIGYFLENQKNQRYSYLWWLIKLFPRDFLKKTNYGCPCVNILNVGILNKLNQTFPNYMNLTSWMFLCSESLYENRTDVFNYIWKSQGKNIVSTEINYIIQHRYPNNYPVITMMLATTNYENVQQSYGKKLSKLPINLLQKLYTETIMNLYYKYHEQLTNVRKSTISKQQFIVLLKKLQYEYSLQFHTQFILNHNHDSDFWFYNVLFDDKDIFLFNLNQIKQQSNSFITKICSKILSFKSTNLYFWVLKKWKKLDHTQTLSLESVYQDEKLLLKAFSSCEKFGSLDFSLFLTRLIEYSSLPIFTLASNILPILIAKVEGVITFNKIESPSHFDFLIKLNSQCCWSSVTFSDTYTMLHVLRYLKSINYNLNHFEHFHMEGQFLKNLIQKPHQDLFDFWVDNYSEDNNASNEILAMMFNFDVFDKWLIWSIDFRNHSLLFDFYLQRFQISFDLLRELFLLRFNHVAFLNVLPYLVVLKRHQLLKNAQVLIVENEEMFKEQVGLQLWLKVNKVD